MATIGKYLKNIRTEKNISVKSLSETTKVNQRIIISLENDDFSDLPSLPYLKCFLRSFSNVLELDETLAEGLLIKTYEEKHVPKSLRARIPKSATVRKLFLLDTFFLMGLIKYFLKSTALHIILALMICSYLAYSVFNYFESYRMNSLPISASNTLQPVPANSISTNKKYDIIIIASYATSWVTYNFGKAKAKGLMLKQGEHLSFKTNKGSIIFGNPKALHLYVNGKEINLKLHSKPSGIAKVQFSETAPYIKTNIARALAFDKNL